MTNFFWIAMGGAAGAVSRYILQSGCLLLLPNYPLGTSLATLVGSFLAGLIYAGFPNIEAQYKVFILTGFLGALTTLSSLTVEVVLLLQSGRPAVAMLHWLASAVLAVLGCYLGFILGIRVN